MPLDNPSMNLYSYHTNPKELYGYDMRLKMPGFATSEFRTKWLELTRDSYRKSDEEDLIDKYLPLIATSPANAYFATDLMSGPYTYKEWAFKIEPYIIKDPKWATFYAMNIKKDRWLEAEPYIAKNPRAAFTYAKHVIHGRWPEGESAIMQDTQWATDYADQILEKRWVEAEEMMIKHSTGNHQELLNYAKKWIKGEWPEGEKAFIQNPRAIVWYARDILKHRWKKAEPILEMKDPYWWEHYKEVFKL